MSFTIECECGKRFRGREEYVGRRMRCPACGRLLTIQPAKLKTEETVRPRITPPPARANHMAPETEQTHSPLNEQQLEILKETERFRCRIRQAAILFRVQFVAHIVFSVIFVLIVLFALFGGGADEAVGLIIGAIIYIGITCFLGAAYKATWECRTWAPMTLMIINLLFVVFMIFAAVISSKDTRTTGFEVIAVLCMASIPAILAIIGFRAWAAIPEFLNQPKWCQEALFHCNL